MVAWLTSMKWKVVLSLLLWALLIVPVGGNDLVSLRGITIPKFSGDKDDWTMWWFKFVAFCGICGCAAAIGDAAEADMPAKESEVLDLSKDADKKKEAAKKRNFQAMMMLTNALESANDMAALMSSMDADWPSGLAWKVVKTLKSFYEPKDQMSEVDLFARLNEVSMSDNEHPKVLFDRLATVRLQCPTVNAVTDAFMMAHVLAKAPAIYKSVLTQEQRSKKGACTLQDLQSAMTDLWRANGGGAGSNGGNNEFGLSAFAGICFKCGLKGHRAKDCPNSPKKGGSNQGGNKGNRNRKGKGKGKTCWHCGKQGHVSPDCWEKPENAGKRPSWWTSSMTKETGATAIDSAGPEFMMCGFCGLQDESQSDEAVEEMTNCEAVKELAAQAMTVPRSLKLLLDKNIWVFDTGSSGKVTAHKEGLVNVKKATDSDGVMIGNKAVMASALVGDLPGTICDATGNKMGKSTMNDVTYSPNAAFNLFGPSKMMKNGWKLQGDDTKVELVKGSQKLTFDIVIPTPKGAVYCLYFARGNSEPEAGKIRKEVKMTVEQAHRQLCHMDEAVVRSVAKHFKWNLSPGPLCKCEACAIGKARQKNIPVNHDTVAAKKDKGRYFLDIGSVKPSKSGKQQAATKPHMRLMVHETSGLKIASFHKAKNGMVEPTCEQINKWKGMGIPVTKIRLDNAGENKLLEKRSQSADWKLNLEFEFTARDTPQQNHLAEVGLSTIANRGRAMMAAANIPVELRLKVFSKACETAAKVDGLTVVEVDGVKATRFEHWNGKLPAWHKFLRTWGEAGVVTLKNTKPKHPKAMDRGMTCMMVGYADGHAGDVFEMWNPNTNKLFVTRDVVWLKRMFFTKELSEVNTAQVVLTAEVGESTNPVQQEPEQPVAEQDQEGWQTVQRRSRSGRTVKPPQRLIEEWSVDAMSVQGEEPEEPEDNDEPEPDNEETALQALLSSPHEVTLTAAEEKFFDTMQWLHANNIEIGLVGAGVGGGFEDTNELHVMTFDEAMASGEEEEWFDAVEEEHDRMVEHDVWEPVPLSEVPKKAKVLTSTWAMKKKSNGTKRARMAARGFEQVAGQHFFSWDKASPVVCMITFNVILILILMFNWHAIVMDVKGAFLTAEFEDDHQLFMWIPQGFERFYPKNCVLRLKKTIYGTVQAAKQFWKKLLFCLSKIGFFRSKVDACCYFKKTADGLVLIISWVDDLLICGPKDAVLQVKADLLTQFDCDDVGELEEYVGCKIERDKDTFKITQPVLLQSFIDEFDLDAIEAPKTPAAPGTMLPVVQEGSELPPLEQTDFRKGVGKLLHVMKWSRPEVSNAVRECSKFMQKAGKVHRKAMMRVMKFLVETKHLGKVLKPKRKWDGTEDFEFELTGLSDSDFAKDPERRHSVSGGCVFLEGAPVTQRSKMQGGTTLSVTEAEVVAASEVAQDMLFVMRLLESIGLKVKKPMKLRIDNKGAVDLFNGWRSGGRTRHIDTRIWFVRELKEEGVLLPEWIPESENCADIFTKNTATSVFEHHVKVLHGETHPSLN